eukprot:273342-Chlamydomonas_euryale.AAC.4
MRSGPARKRGLSLGFGFRVPCAKSRKGDATCAFEFFEIDSRAQPTIGWAGKRGAAGGPQLSRVSDGAFRYGWQRRSYKR